MLGAAVIYEEGEDMDDCLLVHLAKPLQECPGGGIRDSTLVTVEDFVQDLKVCAVSAFMDMAACGDDVLADNCAGAPRGSRRIRP